MSEHIRAPYTTKDENSYIRIAFSKLYSEKNIQMIVFKKLYRIIFRAQQRSTENYVHGKAFRELQRITFR